MEQSSCRPITVLWFYLLLLRITNVQCTHGQIFYKKIEFSLNISYDPENHIYPVIDLQKSSCPFIPMSFCNNNDAYWKLFKEGCHPSCPNGTRVQCVENNENNQFKHLLLVCAPIGNCSTDARNIVYFDENKPDRYQLGQMKCEDGHYHQRSVICFGECERDNSIVVLQEATLTSRAIVHCNYKYDFCNPEKPKLFELSSEPNVCLYRQYPRCRFGMERLPDCSCKMSCPDKRYYREPYNDFRCKKKSSIILVSTTNTQLLKVNAQLRPFSTGLRLSYSFSSERDISPKILKIIYRKIGSHRALALPDRELSDNVSRKHVDIESLYAGQTYLLTITLLFEHVDKMRNYTISMTGTVQPRPVINLTSISYDKKKSIELSWKAPLKSKQDSYRIEHRLVRRNPKRAWSNNITQQSNFTIANVFPGEEYEAHVCSISNGTDSMDKTTSLIIPPLPPQELLVHFPSLSLRDLKVFWYTNDTQTHVEKWYLTYNCSNGDKEHLDVPYPDHSRRVVASLTNVQAGQLCIILVYSVVGDVFSTFPAQLKFNVPSKEQKSDLTKLSLILGTGVVCVVVLILVIFLVVLHVYKKVPVIRNIRHTLRIGRFVANIFGGSNVNVNLRNIDDNLLNNEHDTQEQISETDDEER